MSKNQIAILQRALIWKKNAKKRAEQFLKGNTIDPFLISEKLEKGNELLENLLGKKTTSLLSVFNNIADAYIIWDLKGNIYKLNDAAVQLFGYNLEKESLTIKKLIYEKDWKLAMQSFSTLKKVGSVKNINLRLLTKSHEIIWVQVNEVLIYDKQYNPIAAQSIIKDITEQKLVEIALKKSKKKQFLNEKTLIEEQKKFQLIVDNASVIISESNYKGDFTYVNPVGVRKLGYSLKEFKKINFLELVEQSHKDRVQAFYKNQLTQKTKESYIEVLALTKDGEEMWFGQNVNFIFNSEGKVENIITVGKDITSEIRKNELILQQKKELNLIVDNSTFGIALIDQNKIMKCNRAFHELLGYSQNEILKLTINSISHAKDIKESNRLVKDMDSGKIDEFTIKIKFIQKKGTAVWTRTTVNAVRHKEGNLKYQLIFVEDITKEREKDKKGQVINDIVKAILGKVNTYEISWEIVNIIADYLDTSDCVIYIHNGETNNFDQVAAYGEKVKEGQIIDKLSIPMGKGIVGDVGKTGKAEIINDTTKDKRYIVDDNQRLSEISVPIISKDKVIGVIDSEHSTKNYYKPEHLETLTNIARIVSMQLDNAIIYDLKKKAEEKSVLLLQDLEKSNVELQEYAHVVSHDLKSPLRSINALVSWLKEDNYNKFDDNSIKNFNLIESTLENMEQLICDVLDYSSVVSDNIAQESVDLSQIIKSIIAGFQPLSNMSFKVLTKLPKVNGDKTRFKQLFQNLISNAVKYNNKEEGIISIGYSNNKTHHKFSIKDNGMGIEKEYFEKIFEMFQSLHVGMKSTGIGLSIVKKIVDLYKGDIWLESKIGIGTTFYFTIKK